MSNLQCPVNRSRAPPSRLKPPTKLESPTAAPCASALLQPPRARDENRAPANGASAPAPPTSPANPVTAQVVSEARTRSSQLSSFMQETQRRMEEQERRLQSMIRHQQQQMASGPVAASRNGSSGTVAAELEALHAMITSQKHLIDTLQLEKAQVSNALQAERLSKQMLDNEVTQRKARWEQAEQRLLELERQLAEERARARGPTEEEVARQRALERDCAELEQALAAERHQHQKTMEENEAEVRRARRLAEDEADARLRQATRMLQDGVEEARRSAETAHAQLAQAETRATQLRAQLTEHEAAAARSRQAIEQLEADCQRLQRQTDDLRAALQREQDERGRVESERDAARADATQLRASCTSMQNALAAVQAEKAALESSVGTHQRRVQEHAGEIDELRAQIKRQLRSIAEMEDQAREDERARRELHNLVQELKGNIRVFCRIRPLLDVERATTPENLFQPVARSRGRGLEVYAPTEDGAAGAGKSRPGGGGGGECPAALLPPTHAAVSSNAERPRWAFQFDRVFDAASTQSDVFEEISQLVQSALDGYKVCIFAYGQTGSGKTHTMLGGADDPGMIPRSVQQVFEHAARLAEQGWQFTFHAVFLEIYNEHIRDLLAKDAGTASAAPDGGDSAGNSGTRYVIKTDPQTGTTFVSDLRLVPVRTPADLQRLLASSARHRATASTLMNERSSRSHSVFRLYIRGDNTEQQQHTYGLLNLIDLAGSERLARSHSQGDRLRETQHINRSLSALGDVIAALANRDKHVPFRNSKLTHLLQDSLGGDSKTLMFVNISPSTESFPETLCSLRFAAKVNACEIGTAQRTQRISFREG
ncbi:hypothetical protein CDCA_CDCA03G0836 [Cyanidium caldarium]|uniref:Kinesin motor domain-containing protein n=1 Tax=Cyanidium caldarium TaxID=2771 RepID=A0AAV9IRV3_CYACA|nr:hypothetical protein CDCA_CDCA03G0836 [Cyanidium caldarium]